MNEENCWREIMQKREGGGGELKRGKVIPRESEREREGRYGEEEEEEDILTIGDGNVGVIK